MALLSAHAGAELAANPIAGWRADELGQHTPLIVCDDCGRDHNDKTGLKRIGCFNLIINRNTLLRATIQLFCRHFDRPPVHHQPTDSSSVGATVQTVLEEPAARHHNVEIA